MVSAIASKAGSGSGLMAILSFPVIIPVILVLINSAKMPWMVLITVLI
jgi:heme exporter protein B